jgi:hypothetical protein
MKGRPLSSTEKKHTKLCSDLVRVEKELNNKRLGEKRRKGLLHQKDCLKKGISSLMDSVSLPRPIENKKSVHNDESEVIKDFVLMCKKCQTNKLHPGKYCQSCGHTEFEKNCIVVLGDFIKPSKLLVSENPPARPGAALVGFSFLTQPLS